MVRVASENLGDKHDSGLKDNPITAKTASFQLTNVSWMESGCERDFRVRRGRASSAITTTIGDKVIVRRAFAISGSIGRRDRCGWWKADEPHIRRFDTNQHVIELKNIETGGKSTYHAVPSDDACPIGRPRHRMELHDSRHAAVSMFSARSRVDSCRIDRMVRLICFPPATSSLLSIDPEDSEVWRTDYLSSASWVVIAERCLPVVLENLFRNQLSIHETFGELKACRLRGNADCSQAGDHAYRPGFRRHSDHFWLAF